MKPIPLLALQKMPGIGTKTIEKVLSLPNIDESATPEELIDILKTAKASFGKIIVPDIQAAQIAWKKAHYIWEISKEHNIHIITRGEDEYPELLAQIPDSPALLHVKGNINALKKDCIAIIGTRKPIEFSKAQARKISSSYASEGYAVISGLAAGIDTAAHRGALDVDGTTIAVLAHGLDTIYPASNRELAESILNKNGALISEYPYGTKINQSYFVARDRIQSGLSLGVFVIETNIKGGTMHTVNFSEKQKRALYVLKHPEILKNNPNIAGNAQLIEGKRGIAFDADNDISSIKIELERVKHKFNSKLFLQSVQEWETFNKISEASESEKNSLLEKQMNDEVKKKKTIKTTFADFL
ncbi:DNA-processing protein DprA [Methanolobus chelungpuianus]|uniref:DNA-processing protein DprA n=1 Tax=Methanolobus chelungpuianus TaxID=502115 RepID=UPI002113FF59|nr:DNA-processing protein DprA [Methanolobus chelungpuianus]